MKYKILVVADEIHCDIVFEPHKYVPFATVMDGVEEITITCTSPSKTFNLAGLQISNIMFHNKKLYDSFDKQMFANGLYLTNPFGIEATIAAYTECEPWLDNLLVYIDRNYKLLKSFIEDKIPEISISPLEGTYLSWLDFRSLRLSEEEVVNKLMSDAGVWLEKGSTFGTGGEGFQRINLGTGASLLTEALQKMGRVF